METHARRKESWLLNPRLLKWLIIAAIGLLFLSAVINQLQTKTADTRRSIINIGKTGNQDAVVDPEAAYANALIEVQSSDAARRAAALTVLMALDANRGKDILMGRLGDPHPMVRSQALMLASSYHVALPSTRVATFLSDADGAVRTAASGILAGGAYDPGIFYQLSSPLGSSDASVMSNALTVWSAFAAHDPVAAANALAPALASGDEIIVNTALGAIGAVPVTEQAPFKPLLSGVSARFSGVTAGSTATTMLAQIP